MKHIADRPGLTALTNFISDAFRRDVQGKDWRRIHIQADQREGFAFTDGMRATEGVR